MITLLAPLVALLAVAQPAGRLTVAAAAAPTAVAAPPRDLAAERLALALAGLARERGPEAVVPLDALAAVADEAPDRAQVVTALGRFIEDPATDAELRALARQELARQEVARGNPQRAAAVRARQGFVDRWLVIGPFDDEGKRGLDAVYPPERSQDVTARLPGKVREVAWRAAPPEVTADGALHLAAMLRPTAEATAYALAVVDAPRAQAARLWFGGSGRAKVWVNGALALADPGDHPFRIDQRGAVVALRPGPNRILVKLCNVSGAFRMAVRLADERGGGLGLPARDPQALLEGGLPPAVAPGERPRPIDGLVERLTARAEGAARRVAQVGGGAGPAARAARVAEAAARRALAVALEVRQGADAEERRPARQARRAAELDPGSVELRLLAASLEDDRSRRLAHLEAARARAPGDPAVLAALAEEATLLDRPHQAARLLERAVAAAPGWVAARVALAGAQDRAGRSARATADRLALAELDPPSAAALVAASGAARRLGRLDRASALLRTALALRHDDEGTRASLQRVLLARGDVDGAAALLAEAVRLEPAGVATRLELADLLAATGRDEEAEAAFAAALRLCPEEPEAWERRGRARLRAGRRAEALADLTRSLELRPQDPAVKELARSLTPARDRYETPYQVDAAALAAAADGAAPGDDAVELADLEVVRLYPSGLSSRYRQRVVKVLTQRGADAARQQATAFDPGRQEVKVERGRVFKADGAVVEAWDESERSASEPWYRLYYDTRVKTLTFPALAPGDVLEVAWRVDDTAAENLLSDYFGDLAFLEGGDPKRLFDYVLLAPAARTIHASAPAGLHRTERALPGGLVEHRWRARDLPRLEGEPHMPGWAEVAGTLHVSTYGSWEEVNRFYWGLVKDQLRPTPELTATARRLGEEALRARGQDPALLARGGAALDPATRRALVAAVHAFVVTQTRYVGLEFGIHGFKPYRVDQVLARRFGDCKDKASLTHALLGALGIESRLVLLRTRRLGRLPEGPASLSGFNHAILRVPSLDLWLDGTAAHTGTRELPGEDRGATVLVIDPAGHPWYGRLPEEAPEENRTESRFEIALSADGAARVEGRSLVAGAQAPGYRRAYETENDRRATLEEAFNRNFPGLAVERVAFSDLGRLEEDVALDFTLRVPRWAEPDGPGLRFTPFGGAATYVETWASLATRRHELGLGQPTVNRFTYRIALPPGWTTGALPGPVAGQTPEVAYQVGWRAEGPLLVVEGFVAFRRSSVPAASYPAFRAALVEIDRAFSRRVTAAPGAAQETP
ncbi:MAG: DUF3857 domain-containing protein [Anaeromyxobacter sp.]|nr:DUF3857 domain-containing protein [Anaeromyxobacter sp.]